MKDNRSLIEKADLALSDLVSGGSMLLPAQAQKFMRLVIKQSTLMQQATVVPMPAPKYQVPKIKFGQRVLRAGQDGLRLPDADRSKPDLSFVELDAQLFKAEVALTDGILEDNIEGGELRQTIMESIAEAVARDMEEVTIHGNKSSTDPFLAQLDGLLRQATSNVVDAAGGPFRKEILRDLIKSLPTEYLRNKKLLRFITSVSGEADYRNSLAERATAAGDRYLEDDAPVLYSGVPIAPVPLFPENLGTNANQTAVLLTDPKNIYVGIWRQVKFEWFRDPRAGAFYVIVTMRFDARYADESGVAKAVGVQLV